MQAIRGGIRSGPRARAAGFTLTELLVVIAIIGILVGFIMIAARDGVRRAQERSTQALIAKLESGVADRIEAILLRRAEVSFGHHYLAAVYNSNFQASTDPTIAGQLDQNGNVIKPGLVQMFGAPYTAVASYQRAQVIAQFDLVRAELPDVFFVQQSVDANYGPNYPVNFAGADFAVSGTDNYLIPLGAYSNGAPGMPANGAPGMPANGAEPGDPNQAIGIFGASWPAAAGIYKNLGYLPQGYDGADNNGNGLVDEWAEGTAGGNAAQVTANLAAHTHNTARSEMLYALLVEGIGPMGSVFARDDFPANQVQDTDGDGLPEFVDAWGQPLQFFRWPIYYNNLSDTTTTPSNQVGYVAKGTDLYNGPSEPRQLDPLDPNQTLTSLAWWPAAANQGPPAGRAGANGQSAGEQLFETYFHSLTDTNYGAANLGPSALWDRSGFYARRAYYSRSLILSGGPDLFPGVTIAGLTEPGGTPQAYVPASIAAGVGYLVGLENPTQTLPANTIYAGDDITNQGMASPGGGVK